MKKRFIFYSRIASQEKTMKRRSTSEKVKPPSGVEPETSALQVQCSTTKLKRRFFNVKIYRLYKFLYCF